MKIFKNINMLEVTVEDDGLGMEKEKLNNLLTKRDFESHTEGVGLRNSNHRLEQIYGPEFGMEITSAPNRGTTISFRIPESQESLQLAAC